MLDPIVRMTPWVMQWYVLLYILTRERQLHSVLFLFWGDKDDTIIDAIYFLKKKFC